MSPRASSQRWKDYALAVAATATAALVRAAIPEVLAGTPFLAFYPAVAVSAMRGLGPGLVSTVLSSLCYVLWFSTSADGFEFDDHSQWLRLSIFLLGGIGVSLTGHWQRMSQARERQRTDELRISEAETRQQKDLLAVTLASIGDGVIVTDTQARVSFLNHEARRLTGWGDEAHGRPLAEIFKIINDESRATVENPAEKVLRLGVTVGLANHTILVAKDGREIPIDDSGAPIRTADGEIRGVVLVFRDFTAQKDAEETLRQSERRVRLKLESILSPEGDLGDLELADLMDGPAIQSLMDRFYEVAPIPMAIIDLKGKVLVGVGWQDICTQFHRAHPVTCAHCIESDTELTAPIPAGECKLYKCRNHMWDMATPICVGGQRVGNLFTGQFFFDDEPVPRGVFIEQARKYGFDETIYLAALDAVPHLSRQTVNSAMAFFVKLADMISLLSYSNVKLARILAENQRQGQTLAEQVVAIEREVQRGELLASTAHALLRSRRPQDVVQTLCERAMAHLDCHAFFNFLVDPQAGRLRLNACAGVSKQEAQEIEWLDLGSAICGASAQDRCLVVAEHIPSSSDPRAAFVKRFGLTAYACHPLLGTDGEAMGTLSFGTRTRETFSESDLSLMKAVADHVAAAMARLRGEEELLAARRSAEQAKASAESASTAKNDFLAVLSHELRTPLTPVLTSVSMLQRELRQAVRADVPLYTELEHGLDMIHRNVEMEARLIDDLLDVTRIERGKVELHRQAVAVGTVIRHAVEVCRADIESRELHLAVDLKAGECVVHADAARLQQVFWNLLKNAIKFTPPRGHISLECIQESQQQVTIVVSDNGAGIDAESLPRIFNAFEQAGREITRQFGGLGLGLTISKAMVRLHDGTISAHSEGKGKGARFTVRLPIAQGSAQHDPGPGSAPPIPPVSTRASAKGLRIMLVEDHRDTAVMMRRLLVASGHQVAAAATVAEALALSEEQQFDLILSDLGLPDGSGLDLIRSLRQRGCSAPAIALSGYGQDSDIQASRDAGFIAHLTKPASLPKLEQAIAAVAAGHQDA